MNLINDAWIPVRRADGSRKTIAPWQLTESIAENPIVAIASPRPDFDGALVQFLIGLLQTTCTPDEKGWWDWRSKPPSPAVLRERFSMMVTTFDLVGTKGPLFMQERLANDEKAKLHPVSYLLIGAATDSALKLNTDHFQKRRIDQEECLCPSCAAAALYTLQTFAPSGGGGGDGKFTSLRGGGPLTTLILGQNLWETVWLNIVAGKPFAARRPSKTLFPWLDVASFVSEAAPVTTVHSDDMDPLHVFWGMPRRIYLDFIANADRKACAVCGGEGDLICQQYRDRAGGLTYQFEEMRNGKKDKRPSWVSPRHPLSPYSENDSGDANEKRPSAIHPQPGGIGYRHWLGLIENSTDGKFRKLPATVVEQFRTMAREDARLWAFGYDMDNMKARCWYDATMPLLTSPDGMDEVFKALVEQLVRGAEWVAGILRGRIKDVLVGDSDAGRDLSFVTAHFWRATEGAFYDHAKRLRDGLATPGSETPITESWLFAMRAAALSIFDHYSQAGDFDAVNPRKVAIARNDLVMALAGKKLRSLLGLPAPNRKAA